jgi:hypothetical protein
MHLINVKRLAYGIRPVDIQKTLADYGYPGERTAPGPEAVAAAGAPPRGAALEDRISRFLAGRGMGEAGTSTPEPASAARTSGFEGDAPASTPGSRPPEVVALDFVCEEEVRSALSEGRKLPVGPRTIITPSARELGNETNIFLRI